jgi:predicted GNAT family acetyltransferase
MKIDDKLTILSLDCEVEGVKETQFLAMSDGECVGRVGVKAEGLHIATMRQLFVAESHRGQGIGKTLVAECVRKARNAGCLTLNLTVAKCNRQILTYYQPLGFLAVCEFEDGEMVMVLLLRTVRRLGDDRPEASGPSNASELLTALTACISFIEGDTPTIDLEPCYLAVSNAKRKEVAVA